MKAVILAGGEGRRLRPLSLNRPKPMTPLLGRPVLEHIINLLKSHGITQLCLTLCHHPEEIMSYFGDGHNLGVSITYFIEEQPLGTAGGVAACRDWIGEEDFLVMGGDCICDLNLSQAILFHEKQGGVATLVLYPHKTPLEYGLVHLDTQGRITHFLEKPTWGQVMTNLINTGIYILKSSVLDQIPQGKSYDFGKDLFPKLLLENIPMYGAVEEGYWRDMGDCPSYLQCCADILHGRVNLPIEGEKIGRGIWSQSAIPPDVTLIAPCWIDKNVTLGDHSLIGPHVVVEEGCSIGQGAMVQRSVLLAGSGVEGQTTTYGAILCPRAAVGRGATLHRGAVLGEGARAECGATIMENVRIWPGRCTPRGEQIRQSITQRWGGEPLTFGDGGVIRGTLGEEIDVHQLLTLGGLVAGRGQILLGCGGGEGSRILAQAFASGVGAAGGQVAIHRLTTPAQASWLAQRQQAPLSLFVEGDGDVCYLHLFGAEGLPLGREQQRKLEQGLQLGEWVRASAQSMGRMTSLTLQPREYSRDIASRAPLYRIPLHAVHVAVTGETAGDEALRQALSAMGCTVGRSWRQGVASFSLCHGGLRLTARDEGGTEVDSGQLLAILTLIEMENGGGRVAVPPSATAAVELVAAGFQGKVLRLGRDGVEGETLYASLPWLRDGAFAGARIVSRMAVTGENLGQLLQKIPRLTASRREIPVQGGRGQVMEALVGQDGPKNLGGEGIRLRTGGGWVYLAPMSRRAALQVVAEGVDMELSAELCDQYAAHIQAIDRRCCQQDSQFHPQK